MSSVSAYEREVSAFLTFRQSGWPQLKVISGELKQTASLCTMGGFLGNQLDSTVEKVRSIVMHSLTSLDRKLDDFHVQKSALDTKKIGSSHVELKKAWAHSVDSFFALLYFRNIYINKYLNEPEHPGIGLLHTLYDNFCLDWMSIITRFPASFCSVKPTILTTKFITPPVPVLKEEIEAFIDFPTSNCDQLKVFDGHLMQTNSGWNWRGSTLDGTVTRVRQILWSQLETIYGLLSQNSLGGSQNGDLSYEWNVCGQLFLALTYFRELYLYRYKKEPNHPGLSSLILLHEEFTVNWLQLAQIYNSTAFVLTCLSPIKEDPGESALPVQQWEGDFIVIPPSEQEAIEESSIAIDSSTLDHEPSLLPEASDSASVAPAPERQSVPGETEESKLAKFYQMVDSFTDLISNRSALDKNPSLELSRKHLQMYNEIRETLVQYRENSESMAPFLGGCSKIFFDQFLLYSTTDFMTDKVVMPPAKKIFCKARDSFISLLPLLLEEKRAKGIARIFDKGMRLSKIRAVVDAAHSQLIPLAKNKPCSIWLVHYGHRCIISIAQHISVVASDLSYVLDQVSTARKKRKQIVTKAPQAQFLLDKLVDPIFEVESSLRRTITARVAETAGRKFVYYAIYFSVAFLISRGLRLAAGEIFRNFSPQSAEASTELFMAALWYGCWLPFLFSHVFCIIPTIRKTNADFKEKFTKKRSFLDNLASIPLLDQVVRR